MPSDSTTPPTPTPDPAPVESPQKAIARRLLSIAALEKLLTAEKATLKAEAAALFPDPGDVAAVRLKDGTPLGKVRADPGEAGGWRVTDAGALRAWVEAAHPELIVEQVTTVVDPTYVEDMLKNLEAGHRGEECEWYDPATGEVLDVLPGIAYVKAAPPKLVVTPDRKAPAALRGLLGDRGALLGITS